ncbi:MlaE family ABC transporter permease [Thermodesulfobacteriota bacterium]
MGLVRKLGAAALSGLRRMGLMAFFLGKAFFYTVIPPFKVVLLLKQVRFIGSQSVLVIILTGVFAGMVIGLQGFNFLSRVGSEAFLGPTVALPLIKELGPVLTGLMVTGRAGSAIAAEIGIMRISNQIDALELMGLNPFRYLVVPNLLAGIIALPLLTAIFDVIGILGGYLVGVNLLGLEGGVYFGEMGNFVRSKDILEGIYKSLCFGVIISWVCCYKGYFTSTWGHGAEGVSKSTTQAVVLSSVLILIWDYFMTSILL